MLHTNIRLFYAYWMNQMREAWNDNAGLCIWFEHSLTKPRGRNKPFCHQKWTTNTEFESALSVCKMWCTNFPWWSLLSFIQSPTQRSFCNVYLKKKTFQTLTFLDITVQISVQQTSTWVISFHAYILNHFVIKAEQNFTNFAKELHLHRVLEINFLVIAQKAVVSTICKWLIWLMIWMIVPIEATSSIACLLLHNSFNETK